MNQHGDADWFRAALADRGIACKATGWDIRSWAALEIIADKLTLSVVKAIENHRNCIVTADVDGTFDKRGLP
jgi:hypothetical protein